MNMLEFVTVKDSILKFLEIHQDEVIDSDIINNNAKFIYQPNGVVLACIDEMTTEKTITIHKAEAKIILTITGSGKRLLADGGYVNKLIEERKLRKINSDTARTIYASYKRKKQITVLANTANALSVLSAILFKRI